MVNLSINSNPSVQRSPQPQIIRNPNSDFAPKESKPRRLGLIVKVILVAALTALIVWLGFKFLGNKSAPAANFVVDSGKYQAVFLTNGQTYFGKVMNERDQFVNMSQVHYLLLKQPLQNQTEGEENRTQPEYTLIELGKELHGPTSMSINRDHILFIENLADNSKVVDAIRQKGQKK